MSKIRILPENLANQIAAGEVVERPASVVKELVENAIDAGTSSLTVEIEGSGTSLIRVIDNGVGMDQDDILLSLERHATSKLLRAEDLDSINTLGFRGEAIPSIASVSRLSITSKTQDSELGSRVETRFGKVLKVHEMGCAPGSTIEVRDLFGNVPARRKFLKTARTELAHIEEMVRNYALVQPALALSYRVNGREVLGLPAVDRQDSIRRWRQLSGGVGIKLVEVPSESSTDQTGISIHGVLVAPDQIASTGRLRLFVNGRPVRDRLLFHAVAEGLHNFLLKGRTPSGVIFLEVPAGEVDVNVHPTKQEVRFQRPQVVHQLIVSAISKAMHGYQSELKQALFGSPPGRPVDQNRSLPPQSSALAPVSSPARINTYPQNYPDKIVTAEPQISSESFPLDGKAVETEVLGKQLPEVPEEQSPLGNLRVVGQIFNTYILCESDQGLVAIDQHAAQERLLFEKLKSQMAAGQMVRQNLLFPVTVELSARELAVLENSATDIANLGLEVSEFGGATCLIKTVPALLGKLPPEELLRGILSSLGAENASHGKFRRLEDVLAVMACKAAIKGRQHLEVEEMKGFLREMLQHAVFSHCPHGRPAVRIFSQEEIKKWFHRT